MYDENDNDKYEDILQNVQKIKMRELWDNSYDEEWETA